MSIEFRKFWFDGVLPNTWTPTSEDALVTKFVDVSSIPTFWNQILQSKEDYFKRTISEIQSQKNILLSNWYKINNEILDSVSLLNDALKKEQNLKAKLHSILEKKDKKWDFQLKACERALIWLDNLRQNQLLLFSLDIQAFDNICNEVFIKNLKITENGEIKLDSEEWSAFKLLRNLRRAVETSLTNAASRVPKFIIGGNDEKEVQFCRPWGVCCDAQGRILVCDRSNDRVVVFDTAGKFIFQFGKSGTGVGEFSRPAGIAVDKSDRIIVCDKDNHRIQVFNFLGSYLFTFGKFGTEKGEFNYPWDLAINDCGDIAVADSKNHRVQLFSCNGAFLAEYKSRGFDLPRGVTFKPDGRLLVTDFNNHKIVLLNKSLRRIRTYCREGSAPGRLFRPQGITCLKNGYFAVSDSKNYRVQVFDNQGNFINSFGSEGVEPGQFNCPQGIAYHDGNLIVVDLSNNRVQVFDEKGLYKTNEN